MKWNNHHHNPSHEWSVLKNGDIFQWEKLVQVFNPHLRWARIVQSYSKWFDHWSVQNDDSLWEPQVSFSNEGKFHWKGSTYQSKNVLEIFGTLLMRNRHEWLLNLVWWKGHNIEWWKQMNWNEKRFFGKAVSWKKKEENYLWNEWPKEFFDWKRLVLLYYPGLSMKLENPLTDWNAAKKTTTWVNETENLVNRLR